MLRERVVEGLSGLVLQQRNERAAALFEPLRSAFQHIGALATRPRRPGRKTGLGCRHRRAHNNLVGLVHGADRAAVDRREHAPFDAGQRDAIDKGGSVGRCRGAGMNFVQQRIEALALAELDACGGSSLRLIEIARQWNFWIARLARAADPAARTAQISSIGTLVSAAPDTKEEFALFSRSRRTR